MDISFRPQKHLNISGIKEIYSDLSLWALIVSNLIVIVWALIEGWPLAVIIWIYWSQSVAIGILWFFKILTLKEFSTKGFHIDNKPVEPTKGTKIQTAGFFLVHYGIFHLVYAIFLLGFCKTAEKRSILFMAGVFLVYQCFSFFYNRKWEGEQKPNIGKMMFFPYARIIPMHLTIIFGRISSKGTFSGEMTLVLFMLLKTLADVIMHVVEKNGFGDKPAESENQDS